MVAPSLLASSDEGGRVCITKLGGCGPLPTLSPACAPLQLGAPAQVLCWAPDSLRLFAGVGCTVVELILPPLTGHCGGDGGGGAAAPAPPPPPPFPPRTLATCDDEVSALSAHASLLAAADDSGAVTLVDTGGRRSARVLRRGGHTSLATAVLLGSGAAFSGGCDARLLAWDAAGAVREPAGEVALPAALAECRAARRCGQ